jgi:hypothetical protein
MLFTPHLSSYDYSVVSKIKFMNVKEYPFAQELVTNTQGNVLKVIIDFRDYERILEALEDEGLYNAMMQVKDETPLSLEQALAELEKE